MAKTSLQKNNPVGAALPPPSGQPSLESAAMLFLRRHFVDRKCRNGNYSLRAFARHLDCSPSRLSEIFSGKRPVTLGFARKAAEKLSLSPASRATFLAMVREQALDQRFAAVKSLAPVETTEMTVLSDEQFHVLSQWHHFALLSLMETKDFRSDIEWMGRRLAISPIEVVDALHRLCRVGLIKQDRGRFVLQNSVVTTSNDIASAALRRSHRQSLEQAIDALESVPTELRDITSITMAIDLRKLPEAKKMIRDFRRRLCNFLEDGSREEVFNLNVQLIPLSKRDLQ